ncbi:hypothetical protein E2493_05615 [Sphingomonas parva]|uniref:Uncharacterized protein n=1 Tax=Sphingomonas parva TaxID=2555898 RepID=A0A4Y8ZV14_9SPHN|nr:hypothetical protein [Sphingomonas parva]TFI59317.1 hypothetical protein E2493_05615 [Sphingomonas parva]
MTDPLSLLAVAGAGTLGAGLFSLAALRGWRGWLELKRLELSTPQAPSRARSELAALRDRIRRLEAIADGRA